MGIGSCYSCVKYMMFAFNFLFWLLGCAVLGIGIWIRVDPNLLQYVDNNSHFNYLFIIAYVFMAVGLIIMTIGFLGCCGAIRESQCMLALFFVSLFVIFSVLLAAGIYAILSRETLNQSVIDVLNNSVETYDTKLNSKALMDTVMKNFGCCGATKGSRDFIDLGRRKSPPSTCEMKNWGKPCSQKLFTFFNDNIIIFAGVAIGIGVIMLLGMIFSMMLCCAIREAV